MSSTGPIFKCEVCDGDMGPFPHSQAHSACMRARNNLQLSGYLRYMSSVIPATPETPQPPIVESSILGKRSAPSPLEEEEAKLDTQPPASPLVPRNLFDVDTWSDSDEEAAATMEAEEQQQAQDQQPSTAAVIVRETTLHQFNLMSMFKKLAETKEAYDQAKAQIQAETKRHKQLISHLFNAALKK